MNHYIENDYVTLLAIYSKSEIENIDENEIEKRLLEKLS